MKKIHLKDDESFYQWKKDLMAKSPLGDNGEPFLRPHQFRKLPSHYPCLNLYHVEIMEEYYIDLYYEFVYSGEI